jgi:hypothetical protein
MFQNKPECLFDKARKAYQGQTLYLNTNVRKSQEKSFRTLALRPNVIIIFLAVI